MTKHVVLIFQSSFIKPSLEICLVTTKEGIVTLRLAGLAVPGCEGFSTMIRKPTYAVLSQNHFCRELRALGRGGSRKVTNDDEGEGGFTIPPKNDDVIYEQPLIMMISVHNDY